MSETIVQPFPKSTANRKLCVQIFNAWNHIQQAYCDVYPALKHWMDGRKLFIKPFHDTCRYTRSNKRLLHIHKHTNTHINSLTCSSFFFRAAAEYYILDTFCWVFPMANYICSVQWARTFFLHFFSADYFTGWFYVFGCFTSRVREQFVCKS